MRYRQIALLLRRVLSCLLLILFSQPAFTQSPSPRSTLDHWLTNRNVRQVKYGDGKVYLQGGDWYGPYSGSVATLRQSTLARNADQPVVHGTVDVAVSDGNGGWYIAGTFHAVDDVAVSGVAHIRPDHSVDAAWTPDISGGTISSLVLSGNTLYVGGSFTSVNGVGRNRAAAFNIVTGTLANWNPDADGRIETLVVHGSTVYAGGQFNTIGGQPRGDLAALDAVTGVATAWNPAITGTNAGVNVLQISGNTLYVGGFFTAAGGQSRRSLAAFNLTTGLVTGWNPSANPTGLFPGRIDRMLADDPVVYVAGGFNQIGPTQVVNFAAIAMSTGLTTSFSPALSEYASVRAFALVGGHLLIGGSFDTVNGESHRNLALLDKSSGDPVQSLNLQIDNGINTLQADGENILVGGDFMGVTGVLRPNEFAALDEGTGMATAWNPDIESGSTIHYHAGRIYYFNPYTTILGAVNATDGSPVAGWAPVVDGDIFAGTFSETTLYLYGNFTSVNGSPRERFAAIDLETGATTPWTVALDGDDDFDIWAMSSMGNALYLRGEIQVIQGEVRSGLAALDATTGSLLPWFPEKDGNVYLLHTGPGGVYISGDFSTVGGKARNGIARLDATTAAPDDWHPGLDGSAGQVITLLERGTSVFLGGYFENVDGQARNGLAEVDATTGAVSSWQPRVSVGGERAVYVLASSDTHLFVGGDFGNIDGTARWNYAEYSFLPFSNESPVIEAVTLQTAIGGTVTLDLAGIISDPDNNEDLSTVSIQSGPSSGASATINDEHQVVVSYANIAFSGVETITLEVCDALGLCTLQEITIEVIADIIVYNALSPNGDERNEILRLEHIDILDDTKHNKVTIYNRWGDKVFETENYDNTTHVFKGLNTNGNPLPTGTYFYKITFNSGRAMMSGFLALKH